MGEILASFNFNPAAKSWTPRSYFKGVAFGWVPGFTVLVAGNPYLLEEHTFGGYKVYAKFKENWHAWQSNSYTLDYPLEDFYAIAPGSGTHVSVGLTQVGRGFNAAHPTYLYTLSFFSTPEFAILDLPGPPPDYWLAPLA